MLNSEEHQRRSPNCLFFNSPVFVKPRGARGKKTRASKGFRLSIQSNITTASEEPSITEAQPRGNESMLTTTAAKSSKGKRGEKGTKAKRQATRGKTASSKVDEHMLASSYVEPEDEDFSVKVDQSPELPVKGTKRSSDEISMGNGDIEVNETNNSYPPAKRRATKTRNIVAVGHQPRKVDKAEEHEDFPMPDAEVVAECSAPGPRKTRKGGKKRSSSINRKASAISTASKASLRAALPDNDEINATLELDLERPLTDEEGDGKPVEKKPPKGRRLTRTKPNSKSATASIAATRRGTRASRNAVDDSIMPDPNSNFPIASAPRSITDSHDTEMLADNQTEVLSVERDAANRRITRKPSQERKLDPVGGDAVQATLPTSKDSGAEESRTRSKQAVEGEESRPLPVRTTRASTMSASQNVLPAEPDRESSTLDLQTPGDESGHETDASVADKARGKLLGSKKPAPMKKGKKGKKIGPASRAAEDNVQRTDEGALNVNHLVAAAGTVEEVDKAESIQKDITKPKTQPRRTKASLKAGKGKKEPAKCKAALKEPTPVSSSPANAPVISELPPARPTPTSSIQSSDAENQPPSSRPSQLRPPLAILSPSRSQVTRVPLTVSTPTRSPSKNTFSKLQSTMPWTAVDLEQIFQDTPSTGKENDQFASGLDAVKGTLTSPEMKLTVEQWIQFNAQRGEEKLRTECERLVGKFEGEGVRALKTLEGIVCVE